MELFGFKFSTAFLIENGKILAYALHYEKRKAREHLNRILSFHELEGEIIFDKSLENYLKENILLFLKEGKQNLFTMKDLEKYRGYKVYKYLIESGKRLHTYSELAKRFKLPIFRLIKILATNPFLILIPCHRIIRKDGKLAGYTPLGIQFKRKLLILEGLIS